MAFRINTKWDMAIIASKTPPITELVNSLILDLTRQPSNASKYYVWFSKMRFNYGRFQGSPFDFDGWEVVKIYAWINDISIRNDMIYISGRIDYLQFKNDKAKTPVSSVFPKYFDGIISGNEAELLLSENREAVFNKQE